MSSALSLERLNNSPVFNPTPGYRITDQDIVSAREGRLYLANLQYLITTTAARKRDILSTNAARTLLALSKTAEETKGEHSTTRHADAESGPTAQTPWPTRQKNPQRHSWAIRVTRRRRIPNPDRNALTFPGKPTPPEKRK